MACKYKKRCSVESDIPEIGVRDELPVELIRVLLVPEEKVTILLNGGFNKRTEYNYAIITLKDYISGKTPSVNVTDKTEYR